MSIKTNSLDYVIDKQKIEEKYDIFCLETSEKYIKRGAYILDVSVMCNDIKAIKFESGRKMLLLMSKNLDQRRDQEHAFRSRNRTRRKRGAGHCPCERLRFRNQFHQRSTGRATPSRCWWKSVSAMMRLRGMDACSVEVHHQNKQHTAYLFHNERGRETYYNAEGDNLHRELLKAPLSFLRVTSRYSMARRHPVFGNTGPIRASITAPLPEPPLWPWATGSLPISGGRRLRQTSHYPPRQRAGVALRAYVPFCQKHEERQTRPAGANHRLRGCDRHGDRPPSRFPYPEARAVRQSGQADHPPRSGAGKTTHGGLQTGRPCRGRLSDGQGYGQLRSRYMVQG